MVRYAAMPATTAAIMETMAPSAFPAKPIHGSGFELPVACHIGPAMPSHRMVERIQRIATAVAIPGQLPFDLQPQLSNPLDGFGSAGGTQKICACHYVTGAAFGFPALGAAATGGGVPAT